MRLRSGEALMTFLPDNGVTRRRIPGVAIGTDRCGSGMRIHFKRFAQSAPGILAHTGDGITLTLAQFNAVVEWVASNVTLKQKPAVATVGSARQANPNAKR